MKQKRLSTVLLVIIVIIVLGLFIPIDYYVVRPSRAVELSGLITVEGADTGDEGKFYLVTVTQQNASLTFAAVAYFHPHMELRPSSSVLPADMDEEEYRELLVEYMTESQHMAKVVALRESGYDVTIISEGVEVIGFLEDTEASDYLQEGDIIHAVDGKEIYLASEVTVLVQDRRVGDDVTLTIERDNQKMTVTVPTYPGPDDPEIPRIGIYIKSLPWEPVIPIDVNIDTGSIGGPSAGLMFVLEIMNQLLPQDLTAGKNIAGTGTIDLDGKVGRIGGVKQKIIAAKKAGAKYFFVPEGNFEEAKPVAEDITLVPVSSLEDALSFLAELNE
ncbi:MAG: S16 family serine protease [Bacillota bacterium]|nr:S16 family serine protease [Bacillota bacterium]